MKYKSKVNSLYYIIDYFIFLNMIIAIKFWMNYINKQPNQIILNGINNNKRNFFKLKKTKNIINYSI
jgi:hypothetical protein